MSGGSLDGQEVTAKQLAFSRRVRGIRPDLRTWKAIAAHLGVHERTVRRAFDDEAPIFRYGMAKRSPVATYSDLVASWYATRGLHLHE